MLKKAVVLTALLACGASMPALAGDPCKVTLCMWGKFTGQSGGSECSSSVAEFFGIQVWKHGKFKASSTSNERAKFLNQCPEDKAEQKQIINKFGRLLNG
jgi:TrbM.